MAWLWVACSTPAPGLTHPPPEAPPAAAVDHGLSGEAFGTTWSVRWRAGPDPQRASAAIEDVLHEVDARMSTWREDSELSRVRSAGGPLSVSEETFEVVAAAVQLAAASGGAFDPTVERLMELWGFRGSPRSAPPTDDELAAVRATVGFQKVRLGRDAAGRPTVDAGGTALDLSAIAKGHAVDRVSAAMSALGAAHHLVEIGGEVRAHGAGPSGPWRLGIDRPEVGVAPGSSLAAVVLLTNSALATSGNYRNAYAVDGVRVVHTMDPRTGRPHDSPLVSVTVVAPDCRQADGWATALMVLGPERGLAALDARPQLEGLLLVATERGLEPRYSAGMQQLLAQ